jgi:hypothetical protein
VVVASVAEAEYAAAFGGGQVLVELTLTLTNLGRPQQSSPLLFVDNECAVGLATSSVRPKKSKSIDMRLDWIKERAGQIFFRLVFLPGLINPADFFTKILSVYAPSHRRPTLPSRHPLSSSTHTPFRFYTPTHHTPPSHTFQSPRCSPRQGAPYLSLPLTQPHFVLPIPAPLPACNASNKPSLPPCSSSPPLRREPNAPANHGPAAGCWSSNLFVSCVLHFSCLCIA